MLVQRCALDQHRLIIPVCITKPQFVAGAFSGVLTRNRFRALVDTGAQRTVVSQLVIAREKLMRTGHMQFKGIHEPRTHTRYLASIGLWARRLEPAGSSVDFDEAEETLFTLESPIEIVNMDDNENFEIILGFDVLKNFSFNFDRSTRIFEIEISR